MVGPIQLNSDSRVGRKGSAGSSAIHLDSIGEERKKKIAKDFEGVLVSKVMEEMQNSVPESGLFEDETSKQTQSLFSMCMSQDVANKGGFGLWKQIYEQMGTMPERSASPQAMDTAL
ncbi:MAG: rod-binding protein [Sedimentisphaerales bacterium]|nr:rod-binding protein [Sedimentisphaerales bacterium]